MKPATVFFLMLGLAQPGFAATSATPTPARAPQEKLLDPPPGEPSGATQTNPDIRLEKASEPEPGSTTRQVREAGPLPDLKRPSANAGRLKDLRMLGFSGGVAELSLDGAPLTLRVGDTILGDRVRSLEPGRIVLARPEAGGGEGLVLVTFDAQGRARVRIVMTEDPDPRKAPSIR
jgi:hypothetical protein